MHDSVHRRRANAVARRACTERVERPVLDLAEVFEIMSHGWARGLGGACFFVVLSAAWCVSKVLAPSPDGIPWETVVYGVQCLSVMIPMVFHAAYTSNRCLDLMDALNEVRGRVGQAAHAPVFWLEHFLRNLNHGYGLGFVAHVLGYPITINLKFLTKITIGFVTYGVVLFTFTKDLATPHGDLLGRNPGVDATTRQHDSVLKYSNLSC